MVPPCEAVLCLVWPVVLRRRWTSLLLAIHKSNQNHTWTKIECDSWQYFFEKSITESTVFVKYLVFKRDYGRMIVSKMSSKLLFFDCQQSRPSFFNGGKVCLFFYFQQLISAKYYVVEKERMAQSILYIVVYKDPLLAYLLVPYLCHLWYQSSRIFSPPGRTWWHLSWRLSLHPQRADGPRPGVESRRSICGTPKW